MPSALRKTLFWIHLIIGLAAGLVIAITALTGAIMSFEPQILNWADRHERNIIAAPAGTRLLTADELLSRARAHYPDHVVTAVTLHAAPTLAATVNFKGKGTLYINPSTGEIKPQQNQKLRAFFSFTLRLHRWLALPAPSSSAQSASGPESEPPENTPAPAPATKPTNWKSVGESIVAISTIIFLTLTFTGLLLWWPRHWNLKALRATTVPKISLRGKARDWNWHNALGFWAAPILIVITFTGLVIAYDTVANWIGPRDGRGPPQTITPPAPLGNAAIPPPPLPLATLVTSAQAEVPTWENLTLQLENRKNRGARKKASQAATSPIAISIHRSDQLTPIPTRLTYHPYTGEILSRSDLADQSFRRALRTLNLPLHMGTALGWPTQLLALFATLSTIILVYTGFALAYRRFFRTKIPPAGQTT